MNNLLQRLGNELSQQEGYQYRFIEVINFKDNDDQEQTLKDISLINNSNQDYFIFYPIGFNNLNLLNDEYQIYLDTYLKKDVLDSEENFKLSHFFEQNRTLILITEGENTQENRRIVAEIEEDPYFFKKQVLLLNDKETEVINILLEADSILEKCQTVISNSESFNQFKKELSDNKINNSALYSLVAKLYEKLPFLTLDIKVQDTQNLTEEIDEALTNNKLLNLKDKLLTIDSDEGFEAYLEELLKKPKEEMNKHD